MIVKYFMAMRRLIVHVGAVYTTEYDKCHGRQRWQALKSDMDDIMHSANKMDDLL